MQIEIKVKLKDRETTVEKIKSLGSRFWKKTTEKDTYYTSKKGVFTLKESENGECLLIHDFRPKDSMTTALRTELPLDSIFSEKLHFILEDAVGVQLVLSREREQYLLHGTLLAIDAIDNHGTFLEITSDEIPETHMKEEKQRMLDLLTQLGFSENDLETKSYLEMYV